MVFVTFVSFRYASPLSLMIQLCGSMISVQLKELEIGCRDPKSVGDLSVLLCSPTDLCDSCEALD
jgi:hypothetical protein